MSLTPSIIGHLQRVNELGSQQGSHLHKVRSRAKLLNDESLTKLLTELQSVQASLQAECNWLKAELGAAQMTGEYAKPALAVNPLELPHPELPREQTVWTGERIKAQGSLSAEELLRMQAARHREGDHTLDLDDDEEVSG